MKMFDEKDRHLRVEVRQRLRLQVFRACRCVKI